VDIAAWLRELGMERYEEAFRRHEIDARSLPYLTGEDLRELGVEAIGHRRVLLQAIAARRRAERVAAEQASSGSESRGGSAAPSRQAERRQLTVLFCDLVSSTELASRLDPEDMGVLIRAFQACCVDTVARWDGYLARLMGDGALVYFGYPQAHEDDAERAVRAGLELVRAIGDCTAPDGAPLAARIGIATGLVMVGELVGEGAAQEHEVVGETPNLAARLQTLANPQCVVISRGTRRLVGELFELEELEPYRLKGFPEPVPAWRVVGESRVESRFEALHPTALTPLVNREPELDLLLERWKRVRAGEGQVVLLSGEPGIGKSRLVRALRQQLEGEAYTPLRHYSSPHHQNTALYPVIEHLQRAARFDDDDAPEVRLAKLEALLTRGTARLTEAVPLIAELMGLPASDRYPMPELSPQRKAQRTLEVLAEQVEGLAAERPVLVIHEDLHWADPTTLDALGLVVARVPRLPAMVLLTHRLEFRPPWIRLPHVSQLSLSRLAPRHGTVMVESVTGGKPLPPELIEQIVERTDGMPLFVEELTKSVLESGLLRETDGGYELIGPLPPLAIPATLHDSLMARLDRLAPVREVAQIAATIGREFSHDLLAAVGPFPEDELQQALERLLRSGLVFRRRGAPHAIYVFKHALVRDVAYESLLRSKRQQLHGRIAHLLETRFADTIRNEPELIAWHYTEAGLAEEASRYWLIAGERASRRSANQVAVSHLQRGLDLVETLPDTPDRRERTLALLVTLGPALIMTKGPGTPEVEATYARALEVCESLPPSPEHIAAFWGWWRVSRDFRSMAERADRLLDLAEQLRDSGGLLQAHHCQWATRFNLGDPETCCRHIEEGLRLYAAGDYRSHAAIFGGHDAKVCGLGELALAQWLLGSPDRGRRHVAASLAWARELRHGGSLIHAMDIALMYHRYRRDARAVRKQALEMIRFTSEHGFTDHRVKGDLFLGWARAQGGELEAGIQLLQDGLAAQRAIGTKEDFPIYSDMLAETYALAGRSAEGLEEIDRAIADAEAVGLRVWTAELHRRRGELLLLTGARHDLAQACFETALAIAAEQKARSLELRAATSLARLLIRSGRPAAAQGLVQPLLDAFTEGFATRDFEEARAVLGHGHPTP
jgi:predicted ATPase/class 3 adenylate cyclase